MRHSRLRTPLADHVPAGKQDQMSAPNKQYDPVEVAVLSPEQITGLREAALAAIAAAGDLDELKAARLAHAGDRSPLALANAEIGALPPQARAEAGKRAAPPAGMSARHWPTASWNWKPSGTSGPWSRRRWTSPCPGTGWPSVPGTR
jgi:hypothetical protein